MSIENFKKKYLPLHPKLYRIAFALVENKEEAEDLLQETYCKLWNKREELEDIINPEAFAVTLIKNLCLDYLRSSRASRKEETIENVVVATYNTPDAEIEQQDKVAYVHQLIEKLPEKQKQVIKLRGISGCSMEEIEEITGYTAVNIRTLLSRGRKLLKEQYEKIYAV